ncbi:MAG: hypothetical protein HY077_18325 [Elusimicrobia bacterium]|nr:hypothetical protein [Elusimicrobiota bacterium]
MRELGLALLLCAGLNAGVYSLQGAPSVSSALRLREDGAVETAALFGLGMRRLAADLGLVRLLVYYGTDEAGVDERHGAPDMSQPQLYEGGGHYPELGPRARLILDIDPTFSYAALYAAGALAFNLNRPDEALELLKYALGRDPRNLQYAVYVGAIGFQRHGDAANVVRVLEPVLAFPDCPTMIKNVAAFLYLRLGRKEKSAALYREILATSRDESYRRVARRMLDELAARH